MFSIFEMVTRNVVHELNWQGNLIPHDSLIDSDRFHCCSLVCKRKCSLPFFKPQYVETGLTVDDLLEASDEQDRVSTEVKEKKNYRIDDNVDIKMNITLNVPQMPSAHGEAAFSTACSFKLKSCKISKEGKESLSHRKLKKNQPSLFEALKKAGENLYMVIETVELAEEEKVESRYLVGGWFQSLIGKIKGYRNVNRAVTIPSESVLAFRVKLLVFNEECCKISDPNDKKSFPLGGRTEESYQLLENFRDL
ncbi:gasdermin-B isoform X2 [Vombatus ursinus]|uniref:gasdermin-B isoform X2 n=1 Tax=Vombatus ursinus TaxID=29139 RepID=UPI000FFCFABC|nr:gasdermin-B isoform X2 [Vombatus ursinus]